jgi:RNA polymerase sigma-70 factor (ECF subfamily)
MTFDGESSFELLERFKKGDAQALDDLLRRHLGRLRRWAAGRLPSQARDAADTDDVVQDTVIQTLRKIEGFEYRREGALQAYLRQGVMNRLRDLIRRSKRRPANDPLDEDVPDAEASPLEEAIGREAVERYERALAVLKDSDREAIIGRLELGYDYDELARALDKPSPGAARLAVRRAVIRLAATMREAAPEDARSDDHGR